MIPFLPKQISKKAILLYLVSLAAVTILFFGYAMNITFVIMGIVWVVGSFVLTSLASYRWQNISVRRYISLLVMSSLGLRLVWVVFSYYFYSYHTGEPFEFNAADSIGYWLDGVWLAGEKWPVIIDYLFTSRNSVSDSGYFLYLAALYKYTFPSILFTRVLKSIYATASVVLLYNLAKRNFGEEVARLAGIMACFNPNLIIYCGLHLKEAEMLFLMVAFLERADYLLRSKRYTLWTILVPVALLLSLFTYRTVLGIAGAFAFITSLVFSTSSVIGRKKRIMLIFWVLVAAGTFTEGTIVNETEELWEGRDTNQATKRLSQTMQGNQWAKYATGTVMAPMMFVMPFPTMVNVDEQYNQQVLSGGNYVRCFYGGFVLLAIMSSLFVKKNWRDLSFLGAFALAYLGIISMSGFSNSERFLLPGLPVLLIMAAYGVTLLNARNYRYIKLWYWIVPLMVVGWAVFKLGSRGIL